MNFLKRRQYVVIPNLQYQIINLHALILLVNLIVYTVSVLYLYHSVSSIGFEANQENLQPFIAEVLSRISGVQLKMLLFSGFVIICFSYGMGLVVSNKIAGPLYNLNRHLKKISDSGELTKVQFRKGDMLQETAEAFNLVVDKLSQNKPN